MTAPDPEDPTGDAPPPTTPGSEPGTSELPSGSDVIADYGPDEDVTEPSATSLTDPVATVRRDPPTRGTIPGS